LHLEKNLYPLGSSQGWAENKLLVVEEQDLHQSVITNPTVSKSINQSIYSIAGSKSMHRKEHITKQLKTMMTKTEYSANDLELVKEHTSPMPTQH